MIFNLSRLLMFSIGTYIECWKSWHFYSSLSTAPLRHQSHHPSGVIELLTLDLAIQCCSRGAEASGRWCNQKTWLQFIALSIKYCIENGQEGIIGGPCVEDGPWPRMFNLVSGLRPISISSTVKPENTAQLQIAPNMWIKQHVIWDYILLFPFDMSLLKNLNKTNTIPPNSTTLALVTRGRVVLYTGFSVLI
jgi:hypothetical protein